MDTRLFISGLALLQGWGDVATMRRFGCYSSKMTGNAVKMATALGESKWEPAGFMAAVLLFYLAGIVVFRLLLAMRRRAGGFSTSAVAPAVAAGFIVVDFLPADAKWPAFVLSLASGIVNGVSQEAGDTITCMITGHLLTIGTALGGVLSGEPWRAGGTKSLMILASFLLGVVLTSAGVLPSQGASTLPPFTCLGTAYATVLLLNGYFGHAEAKKKV